MSGAKLKFSASNPTETQFERIRASGAPGVTAPLFEAAMALLRSEERKLRFSEPRLDFQQKFERLASAFPAAMLIVIQGSRLGASGAALISAEEAAEHYEEEA
jgi:hypothetical protein